MNQHILLKKITSSPLPCFVHPSARILLPSGHQKLAKNLKLNETVFDHNLVPQKITYMKKIDIPKENLLSLKLRPYGFKLVSPKFNQILSLDGDWRNVDDVCYYQTPLSTTYEEVYKSLPKQFLLFSDDKNDQENDNNENFIKTNYDLGFLFGVLMTMGTLDYECGQSIKIICNANNSVFLQKCFAILENLGIYHTQIRAENPVGYYFIKIKIKSKSLRRLMEIIINNKRSLPHSLLSSNLEYSTGILDGILQGNQYFYTQDTHDVSTLSSFIMSYDKSTHPNVFLEKQNGLMSKKNETISGDLLAISTTSSSPFTSLVSNCVCMASFGLDINY